MHFKPLTNLNACRVLISNDDGINAFGIKLLEKILSNITTDIWVVAPKNEKSGASHAITSDKLRSMQGHSSVDAFPNDIIQISDKHYAVDGTPTDCVRIALNMIMKNNPPDIVISGINNGRNIADDITYSGTIGVAIEGILHGIPSIAVSQLVDGATDVNWEIAEKYLPELLQKICRGTFSADTLININFPNVSTSELKGIKVCRHGTRRFTEGTVEHNRINKNAIITLKNSDETFPPDDVEIKNSITVSALTVNLTDNAGLQELATLLK